MKTNEANETMKVVGGGQTWFVIVTDWAGANWKVGPFASREAAEQYVRDNR